jgi:hypothetical protein
MALPVTIPNEFANATASIPLSQLDTNFNTLANAVNGISDGSETLANVTATVVNATTVDTTNIEVTNIKAKDGTAAGSIANSTGVVTLASSVLTTTDINGGTIDGTAIGGASAAAGAFTTLNTSGAVVFNDAGADVDFRVEGDTDANLLFVDASTERVGVRNGSPESAFTIANDASTADTQFLRIYRGGSSGQYAQFSSLGGAANINSQNGLGGAIIFSGDGGAERGRFDGSGNLLVGQSSTDTPGAGNNTVGIAARADGRIYASSVTPAWFNVTSDGTIVSLRSAGTLEGSISVSGTTVSYNGGHLSRWAQTTTPKDELLVKGTVLSNLDEMNVYVDADGNPVENEQLNKVKVSDVEGDPNVAGVFVNWEHDEDHNVDEINMAMTGDMIIRIAAGTTVQRGDLLMSAGNGTAKPQGDDIVRSKTIAKVTSTHVTCTYADGSFCVPCVLMAC